MTTIDAKNKTTTELVIWLEGLSTGDTVYYTEYPNFHEAANRLRAQESRIAELEKLVKATHTVKGRFHSQNAMCDLYESCGLEAVRPQKDKPCQQ